MRTHSPATGRITALGSSSPQSIRIVQRKRRPPKLKPYDADGPSAVKDKLALSSSVTSGCAVDPGPELHTCSKIRLREGPLVIDVSSELTEALRESRQASIRLREAAKSANLEQHRAAMKDFLAAWQRKRAAWLAMATPLPTSDE
jgi:hypothetical protein